MKASISIFTIFFFLSSPILAGNKLEIVDFHYHFNHEIGKQQLTNRLIQPQDFFSRKATVLLDYGYALDVTRLNSSRRDKQTMNEMTLHRELSQTISELPDIVAYGLCGADLTSQNFRKHVRECLALPHMIGVKLHLHPNRTMLSSCGNCIRGFQEDSKKQLAEVAAEVAPINGVILVHVAHFAHFVSNDPAVRGVLGTGWPEEEAETKALLEVALQFPTVKFVIAHSGANSAINPRGLKLIADYFRTRGSKTRNVYVETSVIAGHSFQSGMCFVLDRRPMYVFHDEKLAPMADVNECSVEVGNYLLSSDVRIVIDAWRTLGMDRVLFGSDGPSPANTLESLQFILGNPYLTAPEKELIFSKNAQSLLSEIRK